MAWDYVICYIMDSNGRTRFDGGRYRYIGTRGSLRWKVIVTSLTWIA